MQGLLLLTLLLQSATALEVKKTDAAKNTPTGVPVFYSVIMGRLAFRHQVSLWLSSVRKLGNWRGDVVMITDKPQCLAQTLKEAGLLGEKKSSSDAVDIFGPGEGYGGNLHIVKRPPAHTINMMKVEKARAWHNVKVASLPHPVSSIVYTDEDIVIAKDLTNFMQEIRRLEGSKHTLALFRDTGVSWGELHTGVVVMFPGEHTEQCLQSWGKKLTHVSIGSPKDVSLTGPNPTEVKPNPTQFKEDAEEQELGEDSNVDSDADATEIKENQLLDEEIAVMGPDQQALGRTGSCKQGPGHDGIKILDGHFFWLPTPGGLNGNHRAEFVHFTNTGRWKMIGKPTINAYLTRIGIPAKIDPTGSVQALECAVTAGGDVKNVNKGPKDYKKFGRQNPPH